MRTPASMPIHRGSRTSRALQSSVAFIPDWSGDGVSELGIGAPYWENEGGNAVGKVFVFFSGGPY